MIVWDVLGGHTRKMFLEVRLTTDPISPCFLSNSFAVRGCRPGKTVQMTEAEVRGLCLKSREIFLSQPILLELEAPLKICGKFTSPRRHLMSL